MSLASSKQSFESNFLAVQKAVSHGLQWLTRCCEIAVVFFVVGCMREDNENDTLHIQLVSTGRFCLVCLKFSFYDGGGGGSSGCFLRVLHLQWGWGGVL